MEPLSNPADQPAPTVPSPLPAKPAKRRRLQASLLAMLAALIIILLAVLISGIPGLLRRGAKNNEVTPSPQTTPVGLDLTGFRLHSISMVAPDEGWVAGDRPRSSAPEIDPIIGEHDLNAVEPIILHYKKGHWSLDTLPSDLNPNNLDMTLNSISMVSATEGWAAGTSLLPAYPNAIVDGFTFPILLHYSDGTWSQVKNPPAMFSRLLMRAANDGWAIGQTIYPDEYGAIALHYNGSTWTKINGPAFASLNLQAMAVAPNGEVWITAVDYSQPGFDGDAPAALLHYDGSQWTREHISLANDRLLGITMVSASEGWAVGYDPGGRRGHPTGPAQGLIVHYHQSAWEVQSTFPKPSSNTSFYFSAVAMISSEEGWAVGQEGVIVHYLNGAWQQVNSPTGANLASVALVSVSEGWAVGERGTILHYQGGVWSVYRG